jgi:hypothetical protein
MSNKKLNAAIVSAVLLLGTAILVTPMKIANAQPQLSTSTNQSGSTKSVNVDHPPKVFWHFPKMIIVVRR